jgi:hypothetical protein
MAHSVLLYRDKSLDLNGPLLPESLLLMRYAHATQLPESGRNQPPLPARFRSTGRRRPVTS